MQGSRPHFAPHRLALLQPSPCRRVSVWASPLKLRQAHRTDTNRKRRAGSAGSPRTALHHSRARPTVPLILGLSRGVQVPVVLPEFHSFPSPLAQDRCSSCSRKAVHSELLAQGRALKAALARSRTRSRPPHSQAAVAQGCPGAQGRASLKAAAALKAALAHRRAPKAARS